MQMRKRKGFGSRLGAVVRFSIAPNTRRAAAKRISDRALIRAVRRVESRTHDVCSAKKRDVLAASCGSAWAERSADIRRTLPLGARTRVQLNAGAARDGEADERSALITLLSC